MIPPHVGRPIKENLVSFKKTLTYQPNVFIHMDKLKEIQCRNVKGIQNFTM